MSSIFHLLWHHIFPMSHWVHARLLVSNVESQEPWKVIITAWSWHHHFIKILYNPKTFIYYKKNFWIKKSKKLYWDFFKKFLKSQDFSIESHCKTYSRKKINILRKLFQKNKKIVQINFFEGSIVQIDFLGFKLNALKIIKIMTTIVINLACCNKNSLKSDFFIRLFKKPYIFFIWISEFQKVIDVTFFMFLLLQERLQNASPRLTVCFYRLIISLFQQT